MKKKQEDKKNTEGETLYSLLPLLIKFTILFSLIQILIGLVLKKTFNDTFIIGAIVNIACSMSLYYSISLLKMLLENFKSNDIPFTFTVSYTKKIFSVMAVTTTLSAILNFVVQIKYNALKYV